MRYFALMDFQFWTLATFLGVVGAILIYIAWGSYPPYRKPTSREEVREKEGHEIESGHDAEKNPIAPFLIFVYVGTVLWSIAYMIYTGLLKGTSF